MFDVEVSPQNELLHLTIPALISGYLDFKSSTKVDKLLDNAFNNKLSKDGLDYLRKESIKEGLRGALKGAAGKAVIDSIFGPSEGLLGLFWSNLAGLSLAEGLDWGVKGMRLPDTYKELIKSQPFLAELDEVKNVMKNSRLKNFLEGATYGLAKGSLRGAGAGTAAIAAEKLKDLLFND